MSDVNDRHISSSEVRCLYSELRNWQKRRKRRSEDIGQKLEQEKDIIGVDNPTSQTTVVWSR